MKLLTLNIQHGGGKRIPQIIAYLKAQNADIIVLTEFRDNPNATTLRTKLAALSYSFFTCASKNPKENSVCIFSKQPFETRADITLNPNDQHRVITARIEDMTIYGVYFPQNKAKASLFQFLTERSHALINAPFFIIGDINTGLHYQDE